MTGTRDAEGRARRGVYMDDALWQWLDTTARHDQSSISDLLEGLVLLAIDAEEESSQVKEGSR